MVYKRTTEVTLELHESLFEPEALEAFLKEPGKGQTGEEKPAMTWLQFPSDFIAQWKEKIKEWKGRAVIPEQKDSVFREALSEIEQGGAALSTPQRAYLLRTLCYVCKNTQDGSLEQRVLLNEGEKMGKGDSRDSQFVRFNILLEKLRLVLEYDHDFVAGEKIINELESVRSSLGEIPSYLFEPYAFSVFSVFTEIKTPKLEQLTRDVFSQAAGKTPHYKKMEFLIEASLLLPQEQRHVFMGEIVAAYGGKEGAPQSFIDFFESVKRSSEPQHAKAQEEYIMRARREWLVTHPEKGGEEYAEGKRRFLEEAADKWKDKGKKWKATVLETEGFDRGDAAMVEESIHLCQEIGMAFREAEIKIRKALRIEKDPEEKRKALFESWQVIEEKIGRRAVEVFWGRASEPLSVVTERTAEDTNRIITGANAKGKKFKRKKGLPDYINNLAELIVDVFNPQERTVAQAFREALRGYYDNVLSGKMIRVERAKAGLRIAEGDDIEEEIKKIFGLSRLQKIPYSETQNDDALVTRSLKTSKKQRQEYLITTSAEGEKGFVREKISIPTTDGAVIILENKGARMLFPEEVNLIADALTEGGAEVLSGETRKLLFPRNVRLEIISDPELNESHRTKLGELYLHGLGLTPSFSYGGEDPEKKWGILFSEEGDILGGGSVFPFDGSSAPLIYAGLPKDEIIIKSALAKAGVSMEECLETGGLAMNPLIKPQIFSRLLQMCGKQTIQMGYSKNIMVVHRGVLGLLKKFVGEENIHEITAEEEWGISEEEKRERLHKEHGWEDEFITECLQIYSRKGSATVIIDSQALANIQLIPFS